MIETKSKKVITDYEILNLKLRVSYLEGQVDALESILRIQNEKEN